ncbi:MAG: FliM/FliN family flagellar motor switch protein [Actinobacteria bacterium]|jgi:flagellar motor switch protein FliN/FliY|nr:FliM/FliN family flagellar motor switch protein [Actinomycetota bacterium]
MSTVEKIILDQDGFQGSGTDNSNHGNGIDLRGKQFQHVSVEVSAWIGKTKMTFKDISELRPGSIVELDQTIGAPIEIVLNREVVLAKGEVVEVGDEYGIRITEIVSEQDL